MFPVVVVTYVLLSPARDSESSPPTLKELALRAGAETWPLFVIFGAYFLVRIWVLGFIYQRHFSNHLTVSQMLLTIPEALVQYLRILVVPWTPGPAHPLPIVSTLSSRGFYLPVLLLTAVALTAALLIWNSSRPRLYLFCAAWMVLALVPVLNLRAMPQLMIQDRYLYLSSAPFCLAAAEAFISVFSRLELPPLALPVSAAVIIVVEAGFLFRAEPTWHDDETLWTRCTELSPAQAFCHDRLGTLLQ
ncbi:MAG TPA: hypothetical protein VEJ86_06310, partial [Candidatus Binataceae bacterium]|nr:hypothetical protein [Candidatus Binataceae bacterium]